MIHSVLGIFLHTHVFDLISFIEGYQISLVSKFLGSTSRTTHNLQLWFHRESENFQNKAKRQILSHNLGITCLWRTKQPMWSGVCSLPRHSPIESYLLQLCRSYRMALKSRLSSWTSVLSVQTHFWSIEEQATKSTPEETRGHLELSHFHIKSQGICKPGQCAWKKNFFFICTKFIQWLSN